MVFGCQYLKVIRSEPYTAATGALIQGNATERHRFYWVAAFWTTVPAKVPDQIFTGRFFHLLYYFLFELINVLVLQGFFTFFPDVGHCGAPFSKSAHFAVLQLNIGAITLMSRDYRCVSTLEPLQS